MSTFSPPWGYIAGREATSKPGTPLPASSMIFTHWGLLSSMPITIRSAV